MESVLTRGHDPDCTHSQPALAAEGNSNPECAEERLCPGAAGPRVRGDSLASQTVGRRSAKANRRDITVRRRDDADDALRSGPERADAFGEMVLAQSLGDEDRQASRDEKGDRGPGASVGGDHAPPGRSPQRENRTGSNRIGENLRSTQRWNDVPHGTMDEVRS